MAVNILYNEWDKHYIKLFRGGWSVGGGGINMIVCNLTWWNWRGGGAEFLDWLGDIIIIPFYEMKWKNKRVENFLLPFSMSGLVLSGHKARRFCPLWAEYKTQVHNLQLPLFAWWQPSSRLIFLSCNLPSTDQCWPLVCCLSLPLPSSDILLPKLKVLFIATTLHFWFTTFYYWLC